MHTVAILYVIYTLRANSFCPLPLHSLILSLLVIATAMAYNYHCMALVSFLCREAKDLFSDGTLAAEESSLDHKTR